MKAIRIILIMSIVLIVSTLNANAYTTFYDEFGSQITIYDGRSSGSNSWYNRGNNPGEDQEVEPNTIANQNWDLEGFFLQGNKLSIVAGFDLRDGYTYANHTYRSGDIFIDVSGNTTGLSRNGYTYEYVLDMDYSTMTYNVYLLTNTAVTNEGLLAANNNTASESWRYASGGTAVTGWQNISFAYYDYSNLLTDATTGFSGGAHDALSVDLSFLPGGTTFISHFTIECGNDNLMGSSTTVPEPATLLLLGLGLFGLGVSSRKLKN